MTRTDYGVRAWGISGELTEVRMQEDGSEAQLRFILVAEAIHGEDTYDYSRLVFRGYKLPAVIGFNGEYYQLNAAINHLLDTVNGGITGDDVFKTSKARVEEIRQLLRDIIDQKNERIDQLQATIDQKNIRISDLEAVRDSLQATIDQKNTTIANLQATVDQKNTRISDLEAVRDSLQATIAQKNIRITNLEGTVDQKNATIDQKNATIATKNQKIADLKVERDALQVQLDECLQQ